MKENIKKILILILLFLILFIFFMSIIRMQLDSQLPSFEQVINQGIDQNFELKFCGVTLQKIIFSINDGEGFEVTKSNEKALYVLPVILSLISTVIIGFAIKKIKKHIEKWKV